MSDEKGGEYIFGGFIFASVLWFLVLCAFTTCKSNVTSERQFIMRDATYKCIKTNELKVGEE